MYYLYANDRRRADDLNKISTYVYNMLQFSWCIQLMYYFFTANRKLYKFLSINDHSIYRKWLNVNWLISQWMRQCDNVTTSRMHTNDRKITFWGKKIVKLRVFEHAFSVDHFHSSLFPVSVIQNTFVYVFFKFFVWPWINILTFVQHQISKQNDFKYSIHRIVLQ